MLKARTVVHVGALALALGLAGCSTMSDVGDGIASIDPTGLLGGSDDNATPDLANVPAAPANMPNADQQTQVASDVNAAGNQAQYSADALRAGTEAAAPPPTPAEATPTLAQQALTFVVLHDPRREFIVDRVGKLLARAVVVGPHLVYDRAAERQLLVFQHAAEEDRLVDGLVLRRADQEEAGVLAAHQRVDALGALAET